MYDHRFYIASFYSLHTNYTMSDYLSTYKAELVDRYLQNISNSEKDMLYALLLQRSNRTTVTERDIFAKLTLWVLLHAPVRESASPRENVNVKVHSSLPLEGIRTLEASEQAQKSVKNKPIVGTCNKHKTYYIHKEANAYTIKQYIQIIPNQPETNNMQFILTNFNGNKGFTFPKFDKHPFDNAVSIIREDATDDACYKAEIRKWKIPWPTLKRVGMPNGKNLPQRESKKDFR